MERIFRPFALHELPYAGHDEEVAPIFFGSSWTPRTSRALGCSSMAPAISGRSNGYSWSRKIIAVLVSFTAAAFGAQLMSKLAADDQDTLGILTSRSGTTGESAAA